MNYDDSPYIVTVILTATLPDKVSIIEISKKIYLNPYLAKLITPPDNILNYLYLTVADKF